MSEPLLVLEDIAKVFPNGTVAVRGVSMTLHPGTVHGVVGANGAGKSTLMKMISGAVDVTSGRLLWKGKETRWSNPGEPLEAGIATVHQHTPLIGTLTVVENVYLRGKGEWRWRVDARLEDFQRLQERIHYEMDPMRLVSDLSVGERQMVAIMQALAGDPSLLILDEPTASLSHEERLLVFDAVRQLTGRGETAVLYVSHLLDEILGLTNQVTVLRDGQIVLDRPTGEVSEQELVESIVGRVSEKIVRDEVREEDGTAGQGAEDVVLEVENLRSAGKVDRVSFTVRRGEVIGIAGLLGSGRSEILQAMFGADPHAHGSVRVNGRHVRLSPGDMVRAGLVLVPEDRNRQGLIADWEIWRNVTLPSLAMLSWRRLVPRRSRELERAQQAVELLSIKAPTVETRASELSGGNAQKVVFAKWFYEGVRVLLLDEPTAGIDIGAKRDIQRLIRALASQGAAVVLVDSEFDELMLVSDRILVVARGTVVAERRVEETTEQELVALASGLNSPRDTAQERVPS